VLFDHDDDDAAVGETTWLRKDTFGIVSLCSQLYMMDSYIIIDMTPQ